jgi:ABC-type dipeptide/oligopeptide/nickel transport system ATPase component
LDILNPLHQRNPARPMQFLLDVRNLSIVRLHEPHAPPIVSGITFRLERGESLIVLGESGGGKTVLTRGLTGLFPAGSGLGVTGEVLYDGRRISTYTKEELNLLRRRSVRYVFQDPVSSLNPLLSVQAQMSLAEDPASGKAHVWEEALAAMEIAEPAEVLRSFPHQLSVGMAQRVTLAMALLPGPSLLVADEPTSAVDVETKEAVLKILSGRQRENRVSLIVATHETDVARALGHRVVVVLGGMVVEGGPMASTLDAPLHPYVQEFTGVRAGKSPASGDVSVHPGPEFAGHPRLRRGGCVYAARCPLAQEMCWVRVPELESVGHDREVRCFFWK